MQIPDVAWATVDAMHRKHAAQLPATEDGARTFTRMCAEQLRFADPAGGWCHKSTSAGSPPSKDCLARVYQGRFEGWDILTAAGAQGPRQLAGFPPEYHDLAGQFIITVDARNHLNGAPPDPHGPGEKPDPVTLPPPGVPPLTAGDVGLLVDAMQGMAAGSEAIAAAVLKLAEVAAAMHREGIAVRFSVSLGGK
jgi:hypothetical protein